MDDISMNTIAQTPVGLSRKRTYTLMNNSSSFDDDCSGMGSVLGLSTSTGPNAVDDTNSPLTGYRKQMKPDLTGSFCEESPSSDLMWIPDCSTGATPATLPRVKKPVASSGSTAPETPLRALRFSGEMEQQTPPSQLLSQLSHIEHTVDPSVPSPRDSGHYEESLLALLRNKDITTSRQVTLQRGCEMPSPATPLWGSLSSRSSTRHSHQQIDPTSVEFVASQPVDIFVEDEFTQEEEKGSPKRATSAKFVKERAEGQGSFSPTQTAEEIAASNDGNSSGSLSKLRHPSDTELLNEFVKSTKNFFAFIDQRPLLCVDPSTPKEARGSERQNVTSSPNKLSRPASKFERVVANVKRKMRRSSSSISS